MIKVLIVEDSVVVRNLLAHILGADPEVSVIGAARDGVEALEFLAQQKPDVITMDITMPRMDGLEATRRIMETTPVPIVIASAGLSTNDVAGTFRAIEAGAVAVVEKPRSLGHSDTDDLARKLVNTVKLMSEVKVIRRWPRRTAATQAGSTRTPGAASEMSASRLETAAPPPEPVLSSGRGLELPTTELLKRIKIVVIGASTGGPPVVQGILAKLPAAFPVPVLVVQHIAPGFVGGMVDWIARSAALPVGIAAANDPLVPGRIYIAPDGLHMGVDGNRHILLSGAGPENNLRPAVSFLFRSTAQVFGSAALGILLTGMGKDGAAELKLMRDRGAVTIAQDKESSVVHGMPGEAINLGAAQYILSPEKIAALLEQVKA